MVLGCAVAAGYTVFNIYMNRDLPLLVYFGNLSFIAGVLGLPAWNAYFGKLDRIHLMIIAVLAFLWVAMRTGSYLTYWNRHTRFLFLGFGFTRPQYIFYLFFKRALLYLIWDFITFLFLSSIIFWVELILYSRFYNSIIHIMWGVVAIGMIEGIVKALKANRC
ncbi:MAG TPA: hypothetical protein DHV12_06515 [Thermotogae bacterium]|nr:hypothetical protein [Thermotogota bacterium]